MNLKRKIEANIKKKAQEIEKLEKEMKDLELEIREAKAYIQAMEDMMKHLPKDTEEAGEDALRPGTLIERAFKALQKAGEPLYIGDILQKIGKEHNKRNRQALSGQLGNYVRQQRIFTRTAPNTFGLIEWTRREDAPSKQEDDEVDDQVIPQGFGGLRKLE